MADSELSWWRGKRGEWYVIAQVFLFLLLFFGPRTFSGLPEWIFPFDLIGSIAGGVLIIFGVMFFLASILKHGRNITPLPYPKDQAVLIESGPYRFVRHPIYSGGVIAAFGWSLWVHGWLTLVYAVILFVFFDVKAKREEQWLSEKFTDYSEYQKRVHKLIPFIY